MSWFSWSSSSTPQPTPPPTPQNPPEPPQQSDEARPSFVMPVVPTYGDAQPPKDAPVSHFASKPSQTSSPDSQTTTPAAQTPNKPTFKKLSFKTKSKTGNEDAQTAAPQLSQTNPTTPSSTPNLSSSQSSLQIGTPKAQPSFLKQPSTPSSASAGQGSTGSGGGGGVLKLMKRVPAGANPAAVAAKQQQNQTRTELASNTPRHQPEEEGGSIDSFLDDDDEDQPQRDGPTLETVTQDKESKQMSESQTALETSQDGQEEEEEEKEEEGSGFDFMSDETEPDVVQNAQEQPKQSEAPPVTKKPFSFMNKLTGAIKGSTSPLPALVAAPTQKPTPAVTENDIINTSSPFIHQGKMINQFDTFLYTTLQEVTLHLPTYEELYTKLDAYQRDYMLILNNLAANTTDVQKKTELLAKALETDDFTSASALDEEINELQAQTTQYKAEINAMNEYINQQQSLLQAILVTTRQDAQTSSDSDDTGEIDITADGTLILPITLISAEFNKVLKVLRNAISADNSHTSSLLTLLQVEKAELSAENDDTTTGIASMKEKIDNFVQTSQATKTSMLQQHDELSSSITSLEDEIVALEQLLAAKKEELIAKQQQQDNLASDLISYDETSQADHISLQNEYHGLQEYQIDLVERIERYDRDVNMLEKCVETQRPQNDKVIELQECTHQEIYSTYIHPYNSRQKAIQTDFLFDHFDNSLFSHKNQITTILSTITSKAQEIEEKQGELLKVQSTETQCLKDIADIDQVIPLLQAEKKQAITMKAFDKAGAITTQYNTCVANKTAKEEQLVNLRAHQDDLNVVIANLEDARNTVANELISCINNCSTSSSATPASLSVTDAQKEQLLGLLKQAQNDQKSLKVYLQKRSLDISKAPAGTFEPQFFSAELHSPSVKGKEQNDKYQQQVQESLKSRSTWTYSYSPVVLKAFVMLLEIETAQILRLCNLTKCDLGQLASLPAPVSSPALVLPTVDGGGGGDDDDDDADGKDDSEAVPQPDIVETAAEEQNEAQAGAEEEPIADQQEDSGDEYDDDDDDDDGEEEVDNIQETEAETEPPASKVEQNGDEIAPEAQDSQEIEEPQPVIDVQNAEEREESGFAFLGDDNDDEQEQEESVNAVLNEASEVSDDAQEEQEQVQSEHLAEVLEDPQVEAQVSRTEEAEAEAKAEAKAEAEKAIEEQQVGFDFMNQAEEETQAAGGFDFMGQDDDVDAPETAVRTEDEIEEAQVADEARADIPAESAPPQTTPSEEVFPFLNEMPQQTNSDDHNDEAADSLFDFMNSLSPAPADTNSSNDNQEEDNSAFDFM